VREHHAEFTVNRQFRRAARAIHFECVLGVLRHNAILRLFGLAISSATAMSRLRATAIFVPKLGGGQPISQPMIGNDLGHQLA
jgi:hypothetical protein